VRGGGTALNTSLKIPRYGQRGVGGDITEIGENIMLNGGGLIVKFLQE
jgi:hypothetical protein